MEDLLYSGLALLVALLGFALVPFGLPGNWLIACAGLLGPSAGVGWTPFWVLLAGAAVAEAGEFTHLLERGIMDPAKVTRAAIENAASVAAMVLTTESLISDIPQKEGAAAPPMPPMDY